VLTRCPGKRNSPRESSSCRIIGHRRHFRCLVLRRQHLHHSLRVPLIPIRKCRPIHRYAHVPGMPDYEDVAVSHQLGYQFGTVVIVEMGPVVGLRCEQHDGLFVPKTRGKRQSAAIGAELVGHRSQCFAEPQARICLASCMAFITIVNRASCLTRMNAPRPGRLIQERQRKHLATHTAFATAFPCIHPRCPVCSCRRSHGHRPCERPPSRSSCPKPRFMKRGDARNGNRRKPSPARCSSAGTSR